MSVQIKQIVEVVDTIDKRKDSKLKPRKTVNHMNTKTTKTTMSIAALMERDLAGETRKIVEMLDKNKTILEIRDKLGNGIGSIIANGIRESYLLGLHFVEQFAERTVKITPTHLAEIDTQITEGINSFWNAIEKGVNENTEEDTQVFGAAFDGELFTKLTKFLAQSSTSMNFLALNTSTLTTHRQVFQESALDGGVTVTGNIQIPKLVWITERDNRVCPICEPLDNQTWFIDEANIPRPVQDTHFGCRCRLLPLDKGKVFNA